MMPVSYPNRKPASEAVPTSTRTKRFALRVRWIYGVSENLRVFAGYDDRALVDLFEGAVAVVPFVVVIMAIPAARIMHQRCRGGICIYAYT
jgi:hypothetical protein